MIRNIFIALINLEAIWLSFILRDWIRSGGHEVTTLTTLGCWQVVISSVTAIVFSYLPRKHDGFQNAAFMATGFAILGLCAALIGAQPFPLGSPMR